MPAPRVPAASMSVADPSPRRPRPAAALPRRPDDLAVDARHVVRILLRMDVRIPANLSLPRDLVAEVDAVAGPRNRSAFVEAAIRDRLRRERLRVAIEKAAGAWSVEEHPEFASSDDVVEWVRARRAEVTATAPRRRR